MLANNMTSDTRKYKVLSIMFFSMFLLVATNNPRGLNNSGRARDKTRALRLCLKRHQKQRASPKCWRLQATRVVSAIEWLQANVFLDVLQGDSKCYVMGLRRKISMTDTPRFFCHVKDAKKSFVFSPFEASCNIILEKAPIPSVKSL